MVREAKKAKAGIHAAGSMWEQATFSGLRGNFCEEASSSLSWSGAWFRQVRDVSGRTHGKEGPVSDWGTPRGKLEEVSKLGQLWLEWGHEGV